MVAMVIKLPLCHVQCIKNLQAKYGIDRLKNKSYSHDLLLPRSSNYPLDFSETLYLIWTLYTFRRKTIFNIWLLLPRSHVDCAITGASRNICMSQAT